MERVRCVPKGQPPQGPKERPPLKIYVPERPMWDEFKEIAAGRQTNDPATKWE